MDIIDGLNLPRNLAYQPDTANALSPALSDLSQPQQQNPLVLEQSKEPADDSEVIIKNAKLDDLINDRWVFNFSFGDQGEIIGEIVDSETGDVIKELYLGQNSHNPIGTLLHIRI